MLTRAQRAIFGGMDWPQVITLAIALLGAVLGVINTWQNLRRDQVRIRVTAAYAMHTHSDWRGLAVTVVNLSTFPITLREISIPVGADRMIPPDLFEQLPKQLSPRASATFYTAPSTFQNHDEVPRLLFFRVVTACGVTKDSNILGV